MNSTESGDPSRPGMSPGQPGTVDPDPKYSAIHRLLVDAGHSVRIVPTGKIQEWVIDNRLTYIPSNNCYFFTIRSRRFKLHLGGLESRVHQIEEALTSRTEPAQRLKL
jgi:hypothetical protein